MKLSNGEKKIISCGLYVCCPINLQLLFTQSELYVLNSIRHIQNLGQKRISNSTLRIMTGLNEKTIRSAIKSLIKLQIIEKGSVSSVGTEYKILFSKLSRWIEKLNRERNPVGRLIIADNLRGEEKRLHQKNIEAFINSEFNKNI